MDVMYVNMGNANITMKIDQFLYLATNKLCILKQLTFSQT